MESGIGKPWVQGLIAQFESAREQKRRAAAGARHRAFEADERGRTAGMPAITDRISSTARVTRTEREWRAWIDARLQGAFDSLDSSILERDRRDSAIVITQVWAALDRWRRRPSAEIAQPIEVFSDWSWRPCHYWLLRRAFWDIDGSRAYQQSRHWQAITKAQRELVSYCERCSELHALLHSHHLHYESVGAERIGIDLLTLCRVCHLQGEHKNALTWV